MPRIWKWTKNHPVLQVLLLGIGLVAGRLLLTPWLGALNPGTWVMLMVVGFIALYGAAAPKDPDDFWFLSALLAPLGCAIFLIAPLTQGGMLGLMTWAGVVIQVLLRGINHSDKEQGKRLLKAGSWSLAGMPLILLFCALTRNR